ncbi:MAG TPA: hypothetical protein VKG65_11615 [Terriglobales bacterium]|nr:hypothetical protein [Terriglobales bacterium]
MILLLLLGLCPAAVLAQENTSQPHSVTGCLQKGVEPGGFFILGEDGTMWELSGKVDATHVGHKVTVAGHVLHRSAADEAKFADHEKRESNGKPYADFQVTSLKMVSASCQ